MYDISQLNKTIGVGCLSKLIGMSSQSRNYVLFILKPKASNEPRNWKHNNAYSCNAKFLPQNSYIFIKKLSSMKYFFENKHVKSASHSGLQSLLQYQLSVWISFKYIELAQDLSFQANYHSKLQFIS